MTDMLLRIEALEIKAAHQEQQIQDLSEMVSESNTGHSYINFGDFERVERRETGLLGAELRAIVISLAIAA